MLSQPVEPAPHGAGSMFLVFEDHNRREYLKFSKSRWVHQSGMFPLIPLIPFSMELQ
jgi:hypothetical protein